MAGLSYAVVGGGMQGRTAALDLASRPDTARVSILDIAPPPAQPLHGRVEHVRTDALNDRAGVQRALAGANACVVALPGSLAQRALPAVVAAGVPTVDMSFTPEVFDAPLHAAARGAGCTLLRDVGVAPGLSHLLGAEAAEVLGGLTSLTIYVGGMPQRPPTDPFRHAVYFNPLDLIAEYTRPARMRVAGRAEAPNPLAPGLVERVEDGKLGALEAFPSDGLRTLLDSYPSCPDMREMTLRWPGHIEFMRQSAAAGRFEGASAAATAADLEARFNGDNFPDWLLMEIQADGTGGSLWSRVLAGAEGGMTAMSRTTALTATAAAHALAAGAFKEPGLHPPEIMGQNHRLKTAVLRDLEARNIRVQTGGRGGRFEGRQLPTSRLLRL